MPFQCASVPRWALPLRITATPSLRIRFAALPLLRQCVHRHAVAVPRSSLPRLAVAHQFQSPPCRFRAGQCPAAPYQLTDPPRLCKSGQSAAVSKLISSVPIQCRAGRRSAMQCPCRAGLGCDMQCRCMSWLSKQCPCTAYLSYAVAHTACQYTWPRIGSPALSIRLFRRSKICTRLNTWS